MNGDGGLMDAKAALRDVMRRRRRSVSSDVRESVSRKICEALSARSLGSDVAVYLAGPDEIDLTHFIRSALVRGIRLFAPRWTGETYEIAPLRGLGNEMLRVGPHGILEPRDAAPPGEIPRPTAWIVPGLAFTSDGGRLGYGGGWYDRLLAGADPTATFVGVAYAFQIVDELPTEPHDVCLDSVVAAV